MIGLINKFKIIYVHPHLLSKYEYFKLECHVIMMENVTRKNMMTGAK
jgi:hypothetical protein